MNSEFENQLQRQPMREIPQHWRGRILAVAQPPSAWWQTWFQPWPQAWKALGAAWVVIFIFHFTTPDEPRPAGKSYPPQSFAMLQQQTVLMAQLLGPADADEPPAALPIAPKPRSERERKQLIG
jgi:hypothetical protein